MSDTIRYHKIYTNVWWSDMHVHWCAMRVWVFLAVWLTFFCILSYYTVGRVNSLVFWDIRYFLQKRTQTYKMHYLFSSVLERFRNILTIMCNTIRMFLPCTYNEWLTFFRFRFRKKIVCAEVRILVSKLWNLNAIKSRKFGGDMRLHAKTKSPKEQRLEGKSHKICKLVSPLHLISLVWLRFKFSHQLFEAMKLNFIVYVCIQMTQS